MFPVQALADAVMHAQFRLLATALPAGAKRLGIVRLADLKFVERADIPARFAALIDASIQPTAGLAFRVRDVRHRSVVVDSDNWPRGDVLHELRFEVENTSAAPITFNSVVTICGLPAEQLEDEAAYPSPPALTAQALELEAQSMPCVPLLARFEALALNVDPANWDGSPPATLLEALDRLAATVVGGVPE
jgi:hypothetical protein